MVTIKDVARAAGVSIAAVSYVLNNKPFGVSDDTRKRILEAVEQLGYTRNMTALNLRASRTRLIGYALPYIDEPRTNTVLEHFAFQLARAASAAGYHLLTFTYPEDNPLPAYDEMIGTGRVDCFVLADTTHDDPRIAHLLDLGFPFVSFGRANPDWDFNWVDTDGKAGVMMAVDHLLALGHTRIAIVTWPEQSLTGSYRLEGYLEAMEQTALPIPELYIQRTEYGEAVGEEVFDQFDRLPTVAQPTAIITPSDLMAISIMNEAERRGHVVGETLSIVGFDDELLSRYLHPPLTTLRQPIAAISAELVAMVGALVNDPTAPTRQVLLPPELIVRESVSRVPPVS
ncbi:MAG: LacI family DNA-binding transcriptional regulator [Anaerolineae bacterium]|nr:LacI family DNA-binding transcriptional regulator [Anaerolineae bacterium]